MHATATFTPAEKLGCPLDRRLCTSHGYNKEFLCITHTVEHNYISPSSTVGIQLHVSALYVGLLQVV